MLKNEYITKISLFLIAAFLLLYPFQHTFIYFKPLKLYYVVFLMLAVVAGVLFYKIKDRCFVNDGVKFFMPYLFFLFWLNLSLIWSTNKHLSCFYAIKYDLYFLIGVIFSFFIYFFKDKAIKVIFVSLFVSGVVVFVLYLYKFFGHHAYNLFYQYPSMSVIAKISWYNVGFGGGRNLMASWLAFCITFASVYLLFKYKKFQYLIYFLVLLMFFVVLLSLSRTAMLSIILFFILFLFVKQKALRGAVIKLGAVLFLFVAFLMVFNILNLRTFLIQRYIMPVKTIESKHNVTLTQIKQEVKLKLKKIIHQKDYGTVGRLELWKYAIKNFKEYPLSGSGIGILYKNKKTIGGVHNYHNIFLQFLTQLGIIGIGLFIVWSLYLLYVNFTLIKSFSDTELSFVAVLVFINILIYYFKSLLMFQYFDMEIWLLISFVGGMYVYSRCMRFNTAL